MQANVNVSKVFAGLLQANVLDNPAGTAGSSKFGHAVQQFEAFFIQSMLKSMRSASLTNGLFDSDQSSLFRDWHDQQLAKNLASKETFAVAKLLRSQFGTDNTRPTTVASLSPAQVFKNSKYSNDENLQNSKNITLKQLVTKEITKTINKSNKFVPSTPEKFVQNVYPHAKQAASKLNTSADVLVAIAALETGWGLHTPKSSHKHDSFNYFGIKAKNWKGPAITNITKEFDGEKMVEVKDKFRAYASPAESFDDFADLLLNSPRYQDVLKSGNNSNLFLEKLQQAGYATDPNYAKKSKGGKRKGR